MGARFSNVRRSAFPAVLAAFLLAPAIFASTLTPHEVLRNLKNKTFTGERMELAFRGAGLAEILAKFHEVSGLTFRIDPAVETIPYPPRMYNFQGYSWDRALDAVLSDAGLALRLDGNILWVVRFVPEGSKAVSAFFIGSVTAAVLAAGIFFFLARKRKRRQALNRERKISLDPETVENAIQRLNYLFHVEKIHRNERLSVDSLAERLGFPPHQLSGIINGRLGKSFTDLVADFRVNDVKKRLSDPEEKANILNIAFDAGFGTKASFNRIFKEQTGLTPSEYRRKFSAGN